MPSKGNLNKVHIETSLFPSLHTKFLQECRIQAISNKQQKKVWKVKAETNMMNEVSTYLLQTKIKHWWFLLLQVLEQQVFKCNNCCCLLNVQQTTKIISKCSSCNGWLRFKVTVWNKLLESLDFWQKIKATGDRKCANTGGKYDAQLGCSATKVRLYIHDFDFTICPNNESNATQINWLTAVLQLILL